VCRSVRRLLGVCWCGSRCKITCDSMPNGHTDPPLSPRCTGPLTHGPSSTSRTSRGARGCLSGAWVARSRVRACDANPHTVPSPCSRPFALSRRCHVVIIVTMPPSPLPQQGHIVTRALPSVPTKGTIHESSPTSPPPPESDRRPGTTGASQNACRGLSAHMGRFVGPNSCDRLPICGYTQHVCCRARPSIARFMAHGERRIKTSLGPMA